MLPKLLSCAGKLSLALTQQQQQQLLRYASAVWEKHTVLNLTRAASLEEIVTRHICDGLTAAATLRKHLPQDAPLELADVGAGCGYIGFVLAVVFVAQAQVTLVESLERRCKFMRWAALQAGISNCTVKNLHVDKHTALAFDAVTERAVGPLSDILPVCLQIVKPGGLFLAFQGEQPQVPGADGAQHITTEDYTLPCDNKTRHLVLYKKNYV